MARVAPSCSPLGDRSSTASAAARLCSYVPGVPWVPRERAGSEYGAGLLSLVVVVAILGTLAVMSLRATELQLDMVPPDVTSTGAAQSTAPGSAPGPAASPVRPSDVARRAVCETSYQAVVSALATQQAASGARASSVGELVQAGWLDPAVLTAEPGISLEMVDGAPTGRVLVDGQPGPAACALRS